LKISIVVPALDEAPRIAATLAPLQELRGEDLEVLVVDGGSRDDTPRVAAPLADQVLESPRGRARQMNRGAAAATGQVLLFLHADTGLTPASVEALRSEMRASDRAWGRFDLELGGHRRLLHFFAFLIRWRSRITGVATGDQAIFVSREAFERVGGYPEVPLMEDVALTKRLRRESRPLCLEARVVTSSRRWEEHGIWKTVLLMWSLRLAYFLGADPRKLVKIYYGPDAGDPEPEPPAQVAESAPEREGTRG
jgi:rSAM/selenodomain-associated transferase 2